MRTALVLVSCLVFLTGCVATAPLSPPPSWTHRGHTPEAPAPTVAEASAVTPTALPAGAAGLATTYAATLHGTRTASGEAYDRGDLTAAHSTHPFGTRLKIVNPATGRTAIVRVNDNGPFADGVVLSVSEAAALQLGLPISSAAPVELTVLEAPEMTPAAAPTTTSTLPALGGSPASGYDVPVYTGTPAPTAPRPAPSAISPTGTYAVQLGAFADEYGARALASGLTGATVEPMQRDGQVLYRVVYGSYTQRGQADSALADLQARGYDGFIRKPHG